jgi:hypothetical protein
VYHFVCFEDFPLSPPCDDTNLQFRGINDAVDADVMNEIVIDEDVATRAIAAISEHRKGDKTEFARQKFESE